MPTYPCTHELHLVTTGRQELEDVAAILRDCPVAMIDVLHIREKHRSARELIRWYRTLKPLLPHTAVLLNDRLDAALAVQADGVQLGGGSLSPDEARALAPQGMRIGRSVHTPEEAVEAARGGADFVLYGHVYESGSKPGLAGRGLEALTRAVQASPIPVIAIGGIRPERAEEVLATGAAGVAVLSGVFLHEKPGAQIELFRQAIDRTKPLQLPRRGFL
ncbi:MULTISPECIES: thiamine phosphate synthase [Paenibacillus]|uniref:Thiamine-phosphate synthase n=3 Tax=Paenibacillus validus TaxID=44253 RepID=A0A7X3CS74_9BACL|nr:MULTISPECIES: thiamine phosphate synthase [Paenibacillus]MUG71485.1 thiamine phosphate synthase [Paenibacillus validus]